MRNATPTNRPRRYWFATLGVSLAAFLALAVICSGVVALFNWLVQNGQARWLVAAFPLFLGAGLLVLSIGYAVREFLQGDDYGNARARRHPLRSAAARNGTHYVRLRTPSGVHAALRTPLATTALSRRR